MSESLFWLQLIQFSRNKKRQSKQKVKKNWKWLHQHQKVDMTCNLFMVIQSILFAPSVFTFFVNQCKLLVVDIAFVNLVLWIYQKGIFLLTHLDGFVISDLSGGKRIFSGRGKKCPNYFAYFFPKSSIRKRRPSLLWVLFKWCISCGASRFLDAWGEIICKK